MLRKMCVAAVVVFLASCGDSKTTEVNEASAALRALIAENQAKWNAADLRNYTFTYSNIPTDCAAAEAFPPVEITVQNSAVVSVYVPERDQNETMLSVWPTVDQMFENVNLVLTNNFVALSESPENLDAPPVFDDELGYPKEYYVDKSEADCDAAHVIVTDLKRREDALGGQ